MTKSQRRRRSRERVATRQARASSFQLARPAYSPLLSASLDENPNRVKRGAARLRFDLGFLAELERAQSRAYSPLTVSTPVLLKSGKPGKRSTQYTV